MKKFFRESLLKAIPLFLSLTLTIIVFFIIYRFDGIGDGVKKVIKILRPFIYGGVMAYLLKTPFNWIFKKLYARFPEKWKGLAKPLSVVIIMVLAFAVIYTLLAMIIPALVQSIVRIVNSIPYVLAKLQEFVEKYFSDNEVVENYVKQLTESIQTNVVSWIKEHLLPKLQELMGELGNTFGTIFGILYNVIIGIIICIYLLLCKDTFARQGKIVTYALLPDKYAKATLDELTFIDNTFVGFLVGKILDSAIVGLICYVFCLILQHTMGLENAVLIAVIVGVTNIIPYFGPYIGAVPAALLALMDGPMVCVVLIIFIIILQQFDGNVLGPKLLSGSVGLSGFWVLFSITFFGGIWGFVGILVGVPVFAVIYDLIKRFVFYLLKKKNRKVSDIPGLEPEDPLERVASANQKQVEEATGKKRRFFKKKEEKQ